MGGSKWGIGNILIDPSKEIKNASLPIVSPAGKAGDIQISVSLCYLEPDQKREITSEYGTYDVQGQVNRPHKLEFF